MYIPRPSYTASGNGNALSPSVIAQRNQTAERFSRAQDTYVIAVGLHLCHTCPAKARTMCLDDANCCSISALSYVHQWCAAVSCACAGMVLLAVGGIAATIEMRKYDLRATQAGRIP